MTKPSCWKMRCAILAICAATAIAAPAQTFTKLHDFNGADGTSPLGYLIQGPDGNFYGITGIGGASDYGTIFKLTPQGRLTSVYSFCAQPNCTDGRNPETGLVLASDGNLYGTTAYGGDITCRAPYGCGTAFKVTPRGILTTIHVFESTDGAFPWANLVEADGILYGTTEGGGEVPCGPFTYGCGTVFKMTLRGSVTTLHTFGLDDGADSVAGLVQASDGNFYGSAFQGGGGSGCSRYGFIGCGVLFKLTPEGTLTNLYSFEGGGHPNAPLIQAADGDLYGTTFDGTIFRLSPPGTVTTLYRFSGGGQFGVIPEGTVQATDGNLYGATDYGGDDACGGGDAGCGSLYNLTLAGILTNLHDFEITDGAYAQGAMLQSTNGIFYGTTSSGGTNGVGTVYSLDMGLGPFVTFVRTAGKVGQTGGMLGQGFTGTTNVSLNGIPASFTVMSDTFLKATVPTGATTGYVTVTTPSGTLTSNVPFHVIP
jgi:uncharacterized repeat protein (TIGR03803 family)